MSVETKDYSEIEGVDDLVQLVRDRCAEFLIAEEERAQLPCALVLATVNGVLLEFLVERFGTRSTANWTRLIAQRTAEVSEFCERPDARAVYLAALQPQGRG